MLLKDEIKKKELLKAVESSDKTYGEIKFS